MMVILKNHTSKVGSGQTPTGGNRSYLNVGIPLIRSQNVLMGSFTKDGLVFLSSEQDEQMQGSRVQPGDVLLNITGASIGRVCVVPGEICPANVNQHVCVIRSDDSIDSEYLARYLASPKFQSFIWQSQAGGTRQALTKEMIENFKIPLFDITDQRRIAARLKAQFAAVEEARNAAQHQLNELTNLANAIIRQSVEHPNTGSAQLGEVLDEVKQGIGATWADYPVLGATRAGLALAKEPVGKNPERYKPVLHGTVFYNPMRIMIGSIAMVDEDDTPGITSPDYVVLRGKPGLVDSRWFYYWLRSPYGMRCIASLARGAVRERMLFNRLAEGSLELPPYDVQVTASKALAELKPMRLAIEQQLAEINLLPSKILAKAFDFSG